MSKICCTCTAGITVKICYSRLIKQSDTSKGNGIIRKKSNKNIQRTSCFSRPGQVAVTSLTQGFIIRMQKISREISIKLIGFYNPARYVHRRPLIPWCHQEKNIKVGQTFFLKKLERNGAGDGSARISGREHAWAEKKAPTNRLEKGHTSIP